MPRTSITTSRPASPCRSSRACPRCSTPSRPSTRWRCRRSSWWPATTHRWPTASRPWSPASSRSPEPDETFALTLRIPRPRRGRGRRSSRGVCLKRRGESWVDQGANSVNPRNRRENMPIPASATSARDEVRGTVPKLIDLSEKVLYGDVWERPGLSKRDRSLITVAALTAMYRSDQLKGHIERALGNGVSKEEIGELITHLAFYSGWPTAMTAARIATNVFDATK